MNLLKMKSRIAFLGRFGIFAEIRLGRAEKFSALFFYSPIPGTTIPFFFAPFFFFFPFFFAIFLLLSFITAPPIEPSSLLNINSHTTIYRRYNRHRIRRIPHRLRQLFPYRTCKVYSRKSYTYPSPPSEYEFLKY